MAVELAAGVDIDDDLATMLWSTLSVDDDATVRESLIGSATPPFVLETLSGGGNAADAAADQPDLAPLAASTSDARSTVDGAVGPCMVRVLGAPRVDGAPTLTPIELSLVTFLACRGGSATRDQVVHAVWGGRAREMKTLRQLVYQVRSKLGVDRVPYRRPVDDDITLAGVRTDLDELAAALSGAREQPDGSRLDQLRAALRLVEGPPFAGNVLAWAFEDGDVRAAEAVIEHAVLVAIDAAELAGDHEWRRDVLDIGMRALPGNERLFREAMRLAAAEHNRSRVVSLFRELSALLAEHSTEPSSETAELYSQLLGEVD